MAEDRREHEGGSGAAGDLAADDPTALSLTTGAQLIPEGSNEPAAQPFADRPKDGFAVRPGLRWANEHQPVPGGPGWGHDVTHTRGVPASSWPQVGWQPRQTGPWQPGPWQAGPWSAPSPTWPPAPAWPPNPGWGSPYPSPTWPPAPAPAWPQPGAWTPTTVQGWPPGATAVAPGYSAGAWPGPARPAWPASAGAARLPASWPIGVVPWGYSSPPPVPPVVEPPGRFHPRSPARRILSLAGRASQRTYVMGLAIGLPAGLALLAWEIAARGGFKLGSTGVPPWVLIELLSTVAALGLIAGAFAQSAQRRADGWQDFIGPSPFLLGAAQQASVLALGLPVSALLTSLKVDSASAAYTLLLIPVYLATYFGLVQLLGVGRGAMTWRDVLRPRRLAPDPEEWTSATLAARLGWRPPASRLRQWVRGPLGDFLLAASMLIPVMVVTGLTNLVLLTVLGLDSKDLQTEVPLHPTVLDQVIAFISVAVLIPIGEEVFFRGYATNAWGRSLGRSSAIIRAGLFFAFIHVINTQNTDLGTSARVALFNFGARVPVALALCWIYLRRRSLVASMSLHGCYNGLIVLISMLATYPG